MAEEKVKEVKTTEWIKTRDVLWYLVFVGFAMNYMIRINLNIAIVSMVQPRPKSNITLSNECIKDIPAELRSNTTLSEYTNITKLPEIVQGFKWDEKQQGSILGGFYWLHWATQIPGGMLAQRYGTKLVFGVTNFIGILLCFAMPTAAYMGYEYLIILRVIQGAVTGFCWPAMHHMTARWIPPNERSKFVTAYLGSSMGAALTFPMCGYIIAKWGWELVFHVCGIIGTLWYVAWYFMVFDSPAEHPRISKQEMNYIVRSLGRSVSVEKMRTPWKSILTSWPVWLNVLAQWGGIWGLLTSMTHAPTYFKVIHGWNIKATGYLSGLPHLMRVAFAILCSQFGDYFMRSNKLSRTNVRKLATLFACVLQGLCFLLLAYAGCNYTTAIIFLTSATGFHGAVSSGSLASFVDLSPNYASILLGLSGMLTVLPGFISPALVGYLTYNNQTISQWQKVFWIASGMLLVPGVLYMIFAKSELQDWNSPQMSNDAILESELKNLKGTTDPEEQEEQKEDENVITRNEKDVA